jgi:hypothetical protein
MVSAMFRLSVLLGLVGMGLGITMGIKQDFALAPAHAHLNLLGFVALFLAALYYRAVPEAGMGLLAKIQGALAMLGGVVFPVGIACVTLSDHQRFLPVVVAGSLIVFAAMALFAVIVFRTSGMKHAAQQ